MNWRQKEMIMKMAGYLAIAAATLLAAAELAHSAPPEGADPALAPWFQSLTQPGTGISCCSIADCRPVDYKQTDHGSGWAIVVDGQWTDVPPEHVIKGKANPTGRPVACVLHGNILCFVEPPMI